MNNSNDIKILRDKTGAGMLDCKKALDESGGDIEKAIDWLRKKGVNTAQKKSSRDASDGLVTVSIKDDSALIFEINSETDFVAKNETFINFCDDISSVCHQKKIDNIEKLQNTTYFKSDNLVKEELTKLIAKLGENIIIKRLKFLENKEVKYQKYLHNSLTENSGKIGVLLSYNCEKFDDQVEQFSKNLAMHIAASDPISIGIEDLEQQIVEKERSIYKEQLKSSGKPDNILEKIIDGKVKKFYDEVCLLEQFFVMENKTKIKDYIANFNNDNNYNFKVNEFFLFKLGQD